MPARPLATRHGEHAEIRNSPSSFHDFACTRSGRRTKEAATNAARPNVRVGGSCSEMRAATLPWPALGAVLYRSAVRAVKAADTCDDGFGLRATLTFCNNRSSEQHRDRVLLP